MKRCKSKKYITFLYVMIGIIMICGTKSMEVEAAEDVAGPYIVIDSYEVTDEKIVPGEDFTLKLTLSNYNRTAKAKDVLVDIMNPDGVAPVYGTVSQVYLGDIGPGESKEISIDYNTWTTIVGDTLDFNVTVVTALKANYITLRIPVGSDSPFSVVSANIPDVTEVNEMFSVAMAFKVLGEENVRDVAMVIKQDGEVLAESFVGIMTPGVTKTQLLSTSFKNEGKYALDVGLTYVDEAGQQVFVPVGTKIVEVNETDSSVVDVMDENVDYENEDAGDDNAMLMGVSGILILVIFLAVVVILRKNK